jgi:hypothetical protein
MMNFMENGGSGTVMMQEGSLNSNNSEYPDEESGDGASSMGGDGSTMDLKDRAAKETKRTLARSETRAGTKYWLLFLHVRIICITLTLILCFLSFLFEIRGPFGDARDSDRGLLVDILLLT